MVSENETMSFFDIGGYRDNVRRYKEGIDQLCEIQTMVKERVDIEANYGKALQVYNEKWSTHVSKLSSSAMQSVWKDLLEESAELQRLHCNVRDRICDEVSKTIALYLKENHHPSAFRASREIREIEDDFNKAQRLWRRQYEKVEKAKKAFHLACKAERSSQVQMKNASGDTSVSVDLVGKYQDRHQRCLEELMKADKAYQETLNDLNNSKKSYIEHMKDVFESCQQKELKRLKFAFEMLCGLQKVVIDIATPTKLYNLHRRLEKDFTTDENRFLKDLKEWSEKFGPDADVNWPAYEPYKPSLHLITPKKLKKKECEVILTKKVVKTEDIYGGVTLSSNQGANGSNELRGSFSENGLKHIDGLNNTENVRTSSNISNGSSTKNEDGHVESSPETSGEPKNAEPLPIKNFRSNGTLDNEVSVFKDFTPFFAVAEHDYDAQDGDEISIKRGDKIEVLRGPDNLNWSYGRNAESAGLFPSAYIRRLDGEDQNYKTAACKESIN